jgi:hypothetical protein
MLENNSVRHDENKPSLGNSDVQWKGSEYLAAMWHQRAREKIDNSNYENWITIMEAANIAWSLRHIIMTRKDVPDRMLECSEILQEFTEISLLNLAVQEKITHFFMI